ncbi:MAG: hypothetical protein E6H09_22865 [Bacteroidetes bacterium]|jgi:hypothetical protein|nr:MAG: hypothetical protein E6H09_22865 [Bacteroidota bacterium]
MKKNILPVLAILLALGLASFKADHNQAPKTTEDYWWYPVEPTTNTISGPRLNSSTQETKGDMINLQDCHDTDTPICLYGSEDPDVEVESTVPTENDNVLIRYTE